MLHLLSSVVQVFRSEPIQVGGKAEMQWVPQEPPLDRVVCWIDLTYMRPGKDMPAPVNSVSAPDRTGLLIFPKWIDLHMADQLVTVPNKFGEIIVPGRFEIRTIPDVAQGYWSAHHKEVQIFEVAQNLEHVFPVD